MANKVNKEHLPTQRKSAHSTRPCQAAQWEGKLLQPEGSPAKQEGVWPITAQKGEDYWASSGKPAIITKGED